MTDWHATTREELEKILQAGPHGLSGKEAKARLGKFGPNRLKERPPPSSLVILLRQFRSPIVYVLLVANVVTLALRQYTDAIVIAAAIALNTIVGFSQERRAERSVHALMRLLVPRARVVRDGHEREMQSSELVPGDLVVLESGSRVPADVRLISTTTLSIDESMLTGESMPANKQSALLATAVPVFDRANMAYAGATVTRGRGRGYVVATGMNTLLGGIAERVRTLEQAATPLQQRMVRFTRVITSVVLVSSALAFAIGVALGTSAPQMFLVAVAMAVSAVPEGLPAAFTITFAIGVRRMAHRNAIIRRLPAVETLGSTTVIGSDKTGTLTENRMTVQEIWAGRHTHVLRGSAQDIGLASTSAVETSEALRLSLLAGVLANEAEMYLAAEGMVSRGDPTEVALLKAAEDMGMEHEQVRAEYPLFAEIPFEPEQQYSASIRVSQGRHLLFVKGAPERVLGMCTRMLAPDGDTEPLEAATIHAVASDMAGRGLRVLAMAYAELLQRPASAEQIGEPEQLVFLGVVGMLDPPRRGVREAIDGCREAGMRVVMITGDHAHTAQAIARELAIVKDADGVLTGSDISAMDAQELRRRVGKVSIYARVTPEDKLRIVRALQENHEVVAITGDGVNDAPALRAADIGIAMGKSGTDVAREAADVVLADDNFVSIYAAVEQGRITFDNLRNVTFFLISTGIAEILTILASLVLRWPLPFLPAQILWLNLVTNGLQDVALAFEPGSPDVLKRRPRSRREGILSALLWERVALTGVVMGMGTLLLFDYALQNTGSLAHARSVALTTMVLFQVFQAGNARSETLSVFRLSPISNPFLFVATAAALAAHIGALYFGWTQFLLRVEPIALEEWVSMGAVAASIVVAVEAHKWLRRPAH